MEDSPQTRSSAPKLGDVIDYEYVVELEGDNALAYVVELAGRGKKILELGAGAGMQTQFIARHNDVVAVEINPSAAEKLKAFVERVYPLDLNTPDWAAALRDEGVFDAVIAADVLEHLYDPWTAINEMKKLIKPDGEIIVSLPYLGNAAILGCLYEDDFEYRDIGLLDKTHIRFFGLRNIEALHANAGLAIIDCRIVLRRPEVTEFHERWNRLPKRVQRALSISPHSSIYQIVTVAKLADRAPTSISLFEAAARRIPFKPVPLLQRLAALVGL